MTIIDERGDKVDFSLRDRLVDCVLDHRKVIGDRRWGIVQLYYRAGLSQGQIGEILGMARQSVAVELAKAFKLAAAYLQAMEETRPREQKVDSFHARRLE